MSDPEDVPAVIAAAEHAAATGDLAAAESLLRVALREQETQLGVAHPDVASTLNNLAVVCEMTGKFDEAGRFYQRASELTLAALGPDHPLTTTSRDNLQAFRQARGTPPEPLDAVPPTLAEVSAATPAETPRPPVAQVAAPPAIRPVASGGVPPEQPQTPSRQSSKRRARQGQKPKPASKAPAPNAGGQGQQPVGVGAAQPEAPPPSTSRTEALTRPAPTRASGVARAVAVAVLVFVVGALLWWSGREDRSSGNPPVSSAPAPATSEGGPPAPAPPPATGTATSGSGAPTESPLPGAPVPTPATPAASALSLSEGAKTGVVAVAGDVRVLEARICGTLTTGDGRWECTAPANSAAPGRVSFYTRIASPRAVKVHHRWFRAGVLQQDVDLTVGANPSAGFRTFSRQVIDSAPGTEWRVELRASDGRLLQEARIIVH